MPNLFKSGRDIWEQLIRPARIDLDRVLAHFAISSIYRPAAGPARIYLYDIETLLPGVGVWSNMDSGYLLSTPVQDSTGARVEASVSPGRATTCSACSPAVICRDSSSVRLTRVARP